MIMIMMMTIFMPAPINGSTSRPESLQSVFNDKDDSTAHLLIAVRDGKLNFSCKALTLCPLQERTRVNVGDDKGVAARCRKVCSMNFEVMFRPRG